jgi:hypothetical protein
MVERIRHVVVWSVLLSAPVVAQDASQYQKLADAMERAQREAVRAGDEQLDCAALEQQLVAAVNAPAVQDYVARSGDPAQRDTAQVRPDPGRMTGQAAMTAFSSLVPGGAWAGLAASMGQAAGMQAQTAQNVQQRMQQSNDMVAILPQMLRGQRVIELAQARQCAWLPADVMNPPAGPAGRK